MGEKKRYIKFFKNRVRKNVISHVKLVILAKKPFLLTVTDQHENILLPNFSDKEEQSFKNSLLHRRVCEIYQAFRPELDASMLQKNFG